MEEYNLAPFSLRWEECLHRKFFSLPPPPRSGEVNQGKQSLCFLLNPCSSYPLRALRVSCFRAIVGNIWRCGLARGRERNIWRTDALLKRYDGILVFNTADAPAENGARARLRGDLMGGKLHLLRVSARIKIRNYFKHVRRYSNFSCINLTLFLFLSRYVKK